MTPALREPIPRPVDVNATPEELRRYKADYQRGWRTASGPDGTLDRLDDRRARDAEYDGYGDLAAGRSKWHYLHCPDPDDPEGCGGQH